MPLASASFNIAQKLKFSIKDFFSKCNQIHNFLRIWSHLPKKSLIENLIFCPVQMKSDNGDNNKDTKSSLLHLSSQTQAKFASILVPTSYVIFELRQAAVFMCSTEKLFLKFPKLQWKHLLFIKFEVPLELFPGKFPRLSEERFLRVPHGDCPRKTTPTTENMIFSKLFDLLSQSRRMETKKRAFIMAGSMKLIF